jgi:hypothetical protein
MLNSSLEVVSLSSESDVGRNIIGTAILILTNRSWHWKVASSSIWMTGQLNFSRVTCLLWIEGFVIVPDQSGHVRSTSRSSGRMPEPRRLRHQVNEERALNIIRGDLLAICAISRTHADDSVCLIRMLMPNPSPWNRSRIETLILRPRKRRSANDHGPQMSLRNAKVPSRR